MTRRRSTQGRRPCLVLLKDGVVLGCPPQSLIELDAPRPTPVVLAPEFLPAVRAAAPRMLKPAKSTRRLAGIDCGRSAPSFSKLRLIRPRLEPGPRPAMGQRSTDEELRDNSSEYGGGRSCPSGSGPGTAKASGGFGRRPAARRTWSRRRSFKSRWQTRRSRLALATRWVRRTTAPAAASRSTSSTATSRTWRGLMSRLSPGPASPWGTPPTWCRRSPGRTGRRQWGGTSKSRESGRSDDEEAE
jgi:hypothetical protein